jgi:GPH family glycoside/pentoside/hexuronide:cation symporter
VPGADRRLSLAAKLLYGVGEIAITTKMALFGLFILFFYSSVLGLPALWVGIASALGLLWDAAIDPYIGYRSDSSRSRLGRRHPFMLAGALTLGASFWMIWAPPRDWSKPALFAWLLSSVLLFRLSSALFRIPYLSLGAELTRDYHERTSIVAWRSAFGLAGSLGAASLSFLLFFPSITPGLDPKLSYEGYPRMGAVFGAAMTLAALVAFFGTLDGSRASDSPPPPQPSFGSFLRGFRLALENRAFRKVWVSFSLFFAAVVLNATVSVHFFTWYVRIAESAILGRLHAAFYLAAIAGAGFWVLAAKRAEKRTLYVAATLAEAFLMASAFVLFGEGRLFGVGDPRPLFALYVLAGFFGSALWIVPASMVADVADEDGLRAGFRREGLFFGLLNFGEKIAAAIAVLIGGALMDYFARLTPGAAGQSEETVSRIAMVYGGAPALMLLLAVLAILGYRLDRAAVASIQSRIDARESEPGYSM